MLALIGMNWKHPLWTLIALLTINGLLGLMVGRLPWIHMLLHNLLGNFMPVKKADFNVPHPNGVLLRLHWCVPVVQGKLCCAMT